MLPRIYWYIFRSYSFINNFVNEQSKVLPVHIDVVIVPQGIEKIVHEPLITHPEELERDTEDDDDCESKEEA